ncbi:cation-translocating P-type ATPase [Hungatella sp. L12]|uniref:Cation-translocating P-type ATPase n=1 Tax=Hungatella hominis TaxID=2763050 RepID=A0ABR7H6E0_9FIRM|nr:cation-translocating P-type ATPase [Hungatella hominis]MBC5708764.1 cation-translocating P-type ATPase [Hungatella hominis]
MKDWYQKDEQEILKELHVTKEGLTAGQAETLLLEKGENVLMEGKKKSVLAVFAEQFCDLLVVILIAAAIISMFSGNVESTIVIVAVIILNAVLGTVQHEKAKKSLESLKSLSSPNAKVIRGGQKIEVPSARVVPGDILLLEAGDMVVADGRILNNYSLQVNESSLTGESTNVDKEEGTIDGEMPLADRTNMVYSGSLVTYGRAMVVVTGTGMDTEIGKIASLMNATKEKKTPLQVSLDQFSGRLAAVIMVICAIVFALSLYRKMPVLDSLMFAVALAVAAIPEALSSIVTIVQAMGTQKMAKENAIIKELKAVESLGCVSVICSDKTGTLTQNKMTVQEIYIDGNTFRPEELDLHEQLHRYILYDSILTNDSTLVDGKGIGDPTEYALLEMARKVSVNDDVLRTMMLRLEEIPFDSDRKLMSTKYELHGVPTILTKGAVDVLLDRTTHIRTAEGIRDFTEADREEINRQNMEFSQNGLRVLAFAYKEVEDDHVLSLKTENGFTFLGLVAMVDPPREESKEAVSDAKRAGIRPVMITGDHKITATAIAKQIGIFEEGDLAVTGTELDAMSDQELDGKITKISVYARVSPENKIRIVDAWQRRGNIVSMTGDGVNDAPALKKADIGVAMGITGTEVSKDAASMILADDNFATIIKAVANGRNVYRNIKNAIQFLLSGNMAGILSVLYTSIMALPVPFAPVHLLFINLLTDSLPAIAIGMEPAEKDLLSQKPRNPKEGILTKEFMMKLFLQGGLIAVCTMTAFHLGLNQGGAAVASTMAFCTLTLARLFHGFNCRSSHSIFRIGFSGNWYSLGAFLAGVALLSLVMFVPFLERLFSVAPLTGSQIGLVYLLAVIPTVVIQLTKIVREQRLNNAFHQ